MAEVKYILFIVSETAPEGACDGWFWLDSVNKKTYRYQGYAGGSWVEKPFSVPVEVTFEEKLTFLANIYAGEKKGINANVTLADGTKLKFHKGILWEVEAP
jgi:hypothetical protein